MSAETPQRRKVTAREAADRLGVSTRTVQRIAAEPREEFLSRAAQRRARAVALRESGLMYREIAEEMGITIGAAGRLVHTARQLTQTTAAAATLETTPRG